MCGRFNPLQTDTANESNDKPIASKMIVRISIQKKLSNKTIKKWHPQKRMPYLKLLFNST
jgi:hypothetical protein